MMLDTGLKFHSLQGPFHSVTLRSRPQTHAFIFVPSHKIVGRYYGFMLVGYVSSHLSVHLSLCCLCPSIFLFPDHNLSECQWISPNLVCALILWRSGLGLLMGKFRQFSTVVSASDTSDFSFRYSNFSKYQWIFTNLLCALIL